MVSAVDHAVDHFGVPLSELAAAAGVPNVKYGAMSGSVTIDLGRLGKQTPLATAFLTIGGVTVLWILNTVVTALLSIFVIPGKPLSSFGPRDSWAVITGASDGIGKEYALQIAAKGFNLILASRTKSKLESLSSQITSKYPFIKVEIIAIDFASVTEQNYTDLNKICTGKRISILVNNVGQSHAIPVSFAETDMKEMTNIIDINCTATLRVTKLVLPHMLPHKNGLILTMGSFGGLTPVPYLATYSGSKAFLQQWSSALASELMPRGITVHFVHAYLITSAMSKIRRSSAMIPSEKQFVKAALGKIGSAGGSVGYGYSGSPYWCHALIAFTITAFIGPMKKLVVDYNRGAHIEIRNRALLKAKRAAEGKKSA